MTTVLKLGGSVVTHKDEPETVDHETLDQVVASVADYLDGEPSTDRESDLVLVHGGGSFGHHYAAEHGVSSDDGTTDAVAVSAIHAAMTELNDIVVATLQDHGVPALPVRPLSVAHRRRDDALALPSEQVSTMLGEAFVPVLHGDVIAHEGKGATVLSGDDVVVSLAASLSAERVGLCSTVPGVLDESGAVVSRIDSYDEVASALGASEATDVTDGMAGKVQTLLSLDVPASIFAPDDLTRFLRGQSAGTTIRGE